MADSKHIKVIPMSKYPLWEKARRKRTLLSVTLELTARCNNDCRHCYLNLPVDDAAALENELSFEEIKEIIDEAVSLGSMWFLLTGGEPLLREDFFDIYLYLKKKGVMITLFTNASLISDKHIQLFKKYPPRNIEVSVYGVTEKIHQKVTRRTHLQATNDGIDKLTAASLPVVLKATILRSNYKQLTLIQSYCKNKSKLPFRFDPFLHLRVDKNKKRNKLIISERLSSQEIIQLEKSDGIRLLALKRKCLALSKYEIEATRENKLFKCDAGITTCYISGDGHFRLCSSLVHEKCTYDLRKDNLTDAWKVFTPSIRSRTSDKKDFTQNCYRCNISSFCMWCPAHADLETGELDSHIPYFCDMAKKRYQNYLTQNYK